MQGKFTILKRAALERPRLPVYKSESQVPRCDSGLPVDTRNSMGSSGNVFESLLAREGPSSGFENPRNLASSCGLGSGNSMEHGKGETRSAEFSNTKSTFQSKSWNLEPFVSYWRNVFSEWCDGLSEISDHGTTSWKIPGLFGVSKLESQVQN